MTSADAKTEATRVTLVGMWLDLLLAVGKIAGGVVTQSFALITDGIHSLTDAVTDIFVLLVARVAHAEPDEEHPWGHGRFETLGTIGMGVVFFTTAGILIYDSYQRLSDSTPLPVPAAAGIAVALISIAAKEWIYHYTMRVALRLNSSLLKANAWHSRTDAISSIAVLVGIVAAQQGYVWMDTVAAMFVALIIARIGWELCADSLRELVDTAVPTERRQQLENCVMSVEGIHGVTRLRSRQSGGKLILELHLLVDPRISVSEGHQLGESVSRALTGRFSDVGDVIVHIDPEPLDDAGLHPSSQYQLPERSQVLANIRRHWQGLLAEEEMNSVSLHYLENGIEVELLVNHHEFNEQLAGRLRDAIRSFTHITSLKIYGKLYESSETRLIS